LSFPEGAVITNIERVDENWWAGEYDGQQGLFPCTSPFIPPLLIPGFRRYYFFLSVSLGIYNFV